MWKLKSMKRSKIIAVGLVCLFIGSIMSGLATRTITDTSDTIGTMITNSKGNSWPATGANAQTAIYSLNNATGWVNFNHQFINLTTSLKLGSNCEIFNFNFGIGNNVNKTMLINYNNYPSTTGNTGIYIHDGTLNGNGLNQPLWWTITGSRFVYAHGIQLYYVSNSQIDHVTIKNTASTGILFSHGVNNSISYCNVYKAAKLYEGSTYKHWWSGGIMYDWTNDSTISNCNVDDSYGHGIVFESPYAATAPPYAACCHGIIVSGCNVKNTEIGFYIEAARDSIIDGCVASYCTKSTIYHGATGFDIIPPSYNILISNCVASYCGTTNHTYGQNYILNGYNCTMQGCLSTKSNRIGYHVFGWNHLLTECTSVSDYSYGVMIDGGYNISTIGCNIKNAGSDGILYESTSRPLNKKGVINDNIISNCVGDGIEIRGFNLTVIGNSIDVCGQFGIYVLTSMFCNINSNHVSRTTEDAIRVTTGNNTICNNVIYGALDGIDLRSRNNTITGNVIRGCSTHGIVEGTGASFNIVNSNNAYGCTGGIDLTAGWSLTEAEHNLPAAS